MPALSVKNLPKMPQAYPDTRGGFEAPKLWPSCEGPPLQCWKLLQPQFVPRCSTCRFQCSLTGSTANFTFPAESAPGSSAKGILSKSIAHQPSSCEGPSQTSSCHLTAKGPHTSAESHPGLSISASTLWVHITETSFDAIPPLKVQMLQRKVALSEAGIAARYASLDLKNISWQFVAFYATRHGRCSALFGRSPSSKTSSCKTAVSGHTTQNSPAVITKCCSEKFRRLRSENQIGNRGRGGSSTAS